MKSEEVVRGMEKLKIANVNKQKQNVAKFYD